MPTEASSDDVAGALEGETVDGTVLPRSFLVEGGGPVTVVREHGDATEHTEGEISISHRLETLTGFATFWHFHDLAHWKRHAIREVLEDHEDSTTRYVIDDEQLERGREVTVDTIDSFQGSEKVAIVISLVRSNADGEVASSTARSTVRDG